MKNIAYWILGDCPENLKNHTPQSRKKIQALAIAIIIPTILWFFTGYIAATTMLKLSTAWGLLVGIVCSALIFLFDRMIAIMSGGVVLAGLRMAVGLAMASIGSVMIDSAILSEDIDYYMNQKMSEKSMVATNMIESKSSAELYSQKMLVEQRYHNLQLATANYNSELDGTGGTKKYGEGDVALGKKKIKEDANDEYRNQLQKLNEMKVELNLEKKVAQDGVLKNNGKNSIITRIRALHEYAFSNASAMFIYIVFTIICFIFEMSVVMAKLFSKKSSYELEQQRIEEIRNIKSEQILRSVAEHSEIDKRLGHYGRAAMRAVK